MIQGWTTERFARRALRVASAAAACPPEPLATPGRFRCGRTVAAGPKRCRVSVRSRGLPHAARHNAAVGAGHLRSPQMRVLEYRVAARPPWTTWRSSGGSVRHASFARRMRASGRIRSRRPSLVRSERHAGTSPDACSSRGAQAVSCRPPLTQTQGTRPRACRSSTSTSAVGSRCDDAPLHPATLTGPSVAVRQSLADLSYQGPQSMRSRVSVTIPPRRPKGKLIDPGSSRKRPQHPDVHIVIADTGKSRRFAIGMIVGRPPAGVIFR
jgi:hypothetical protein